MGKVFGRVSQLRQVSKAGQELSASMCVQHSSSIVQKGTRGPVCIPRIGTSCMYECHGT